MEPLHRRRRVATVVGLLAALALLVGVAIDGGVSTPTRTDAGEAAVAAVPHGDAAAAVGAARAELAPWGAAVLPAPGGSLLALVMTATALAVGSRRRGPRHRAPALRAARRRGPPVLV